MILLLVLAPVLLVDLVFIAEIVLGLAPGRGVVPADAGGRIAILVPAHNEASIVGRSIVAMCQAIPAGTRLLLIAHNCQDDTAGLARAAGAEVAALDDPAHRGKGYALAFGRDSLAADPPDIVVIVDADCAIEPGAIERLVAVARATRAPVQAAYLFRPRRDVSPVVQVSSFAFLIKNLVRQRGGARLGGPALLTGSGFAVPWPLFAGLDLATGDLVEDLALGLDLVRLGHPPRFVEQAVIWSDPSNLAGTGTQRTRWEAGFLATARRQALPLIASGIGRGRWGMIWQGLHLLTPPLTVLLLANGCAVLLALLGAAVGIGWMPTLVAGIAGAGVTLAVAAAWAVVGRPYLAAETLLRLPGYFFWKLALYARLAKRSGAAEWVRTERDPEA